MYKSKTLAEAVAICKAIATVTGDASTDTAGGTSTSLETAESFSPLKADDDKKKKKKKKKKNRKKWKVPGAVP
jgi:hypothetical protein